MQELFDLIGGESTLTITNLILSGCIIFHLICEFAHYIISFLSHKNDSKVLNGLAARVERIEATQERKSRECPYNNGNKEE